MGGHKDGQIVFGADLIEHIQQQFHAIDIHAGHRLVQNQNMGYRLQSQSQQHPLQFPAGQSAQPPVDQLFGMNACEALDHFFPQCFGYG